MKSIVDKEAAVQQPVVYKDVEWTHAMLRDTWPKGDGSVVDALLTRLEELDWVSCKDRLPDHPCQVEVCIPKTYGGKRTWQRYFMKYGTDVCDQPIDGFSNDNWHVDVSTERAINEQWYWRFPTEPPTDVKGPDHVAE